MRNNITQSIRRCKREYYQNKIKINQHDTKKLWKTLTFIKHNSLIWFKIYFYKCVLKKLLVQHIIYILLLRKLRVKECIDLF